MDTTNNMFPTPYRDVNIVLKTLLGNVQVVLGDYFTGMYLYGSLASGDFDPGRSDIDPLIVTSGELPGNLISDLEVMHKHIYNSSSEWATRMTGAYIPLDAMRTYSPTGPACPLFNRDEFLVARPDIDWVIHRHVLYTSGITIVGPSLQTIIDPVQPEQLREAAVTLLGDNWTSWVLNTEIFEGEGHQPFIVLTMCRALYTIKHDTVVSKLRSAEWVISNSDRRWTRLIKQAMSWHYGDPPGDTGKTQEFMRYILKEAGLSV